MAHEVVGHFADGLHQGAIVGDAVLEDPLDPLPVEVTVVLRANGLLATGQGVATDILEASARAYVRALSNALEGAAIREAEEATADAATERLPGP